MKKFRSERQKNTSSTKSIEKMRGSHQKPRIHAAVPKGLVVEGLSVLREYIKFSPKAIREIWVDAQNHSAFNQIRDDLKKAHMSAIPIHRESRENVMTEWGIGLLQGSVAALTQKTLFSEDEGLALLLKTMTDQEIVLILDHIQDPRNFGAILRSAAFFNVKHVFLPDRRQVSLTQVVASTAQGGLALTHLTRVTNLSRLTKELKQMGFWIIGADMSGQSIDDQVRRLGRIALILGSEGEGLGLQMKKNCDLLVGITSISGLDSLNVSVATGILLSQLVMAPQSVNEKIIPTT